MLLLLPTHTQTYIPKGVGRHSLTPFCCSYGGEVKRHARGMRAHTRCVCVSVGMNIHHGCGLVRWCACVVYVPRVACQGLFQSQSRAFFRFRTWTKLKYTQRKRVLELSERFAAYQHEPPPRRRRRRRALGVPQWHPPRHTHAHSNHHRVGFGTCSGGS